jgi:hypothetical protein
MQAMTFFNFTVLTLFGSLAAQVIWRSNLQANSAAVMACLLYVTQVRAFPRIC